MSDPGSVTRLVQQLRSDDAQLRNEAASEIMVRYWSDLWRLANRQLNERLRRREDADDVLISTFKSFCLRQQEGQFDINDRDELRKLLVTITLNKVRRVHQRQFAQKRDVSREEAATTFGENLHVSEEMLTHLADRHPGPEEAAVVAEEMERLWSQLDATTSEIVQLKGEGYTHEEIAEKMGCSVRRIERKWKLVRERWGTAATAEATA